MIYSTAHTFQCVCHCIRTMFRVLGVYNFGGVIKKISFTEMHCVFYSFWLKIDIFWLFFLLLKGSFSCREGYIQCKIVEVNFKWYHLCRSMGQFSIWQENLLSWFFKAVFFAVWTKLELICQFFFYFQSFFPLKYVQKLEGFFLVIWLHWS